jgi:hypothetical protein
MLAKVAVVLVMGGFFAWLIWGSVHAGGAVVIMAHSDEPVEVSVGSQSLRVGPRQVKFIPLDQGVHIIKLSTHGELTTRTIDIVAGGQQIVAPLPGQCFALLDVKRSHYQSAKHPDVTHRYLTEQFEWPASTYGSEGELPPSIRKFDPVYVMRQFPCESSTALSDPELLALLGY